MKTWFHEVRKGYLGGLGAALLAWTLAAIPAIPRLALGLSLTDTQVLYIRAGLALFGFAVLALVGWLLYFQTRRKLYAIKEQLADTSKRPYRFQDDCILDGKMFRHKTKPGFFCVTCAVGDNLEAPMIEEKDGWGWSCPVKGFHFVRGPNWKHPEPNRRRNWTLGI